MRGRPYYYVGAGVRCIDLCYHNHCFCLLNVISDGIYQYKHDALFSFLYLSSNVVVVVVVVVVDVVVVVVIVVVVVVVV